MALLLIPFPVFCPVCGGVLTLKRAVVRLGNREEFQVSRGEELCRLKLEHSVPEPTKGLPRACPECIDTLDPEWVEGVVVHTSCPKCGWSGTISLNREELLIARDAGLQLCEALNLKAGSAHYTYSLLTSSIPDPPRTTLFLPAPEWWVGDLEELLEALRVVYLLKPNSKRVFITLIYPGSGETRKTVMKKLRELEGKGELKTTEILVVVTVNYRNLPETIQELTEAQAKPQAPLRKIVLVTTKETQNQKPTPNKR